MKANTLRKALKDSHFLANDRCDIIDAINFVSHLAKQYAIEMEEHPEEYIGEHSAGIPHSLRIAYCTVSALWRDVYDIPKSEIEEAGIFEDTEE